jgi:hypothetical protein
VPLPEGVVGREEEAEHPVLHVSQPVCACVLEETQEFGAQQVPEEGRGGGGCGRGKGGSEDGRRGSAQDFPNVDTEPSNEIARQEGDGCMAAASSQALLELVRDRGGSIPPKRKGWAVNPFNMEHGCLRKRRTGPFDQRLETGEVECMCDENKGRKVFPSRRTRTPAVDPAPETMCDGQDG